MNVNKIDNVNFNSKIFISSKQNKQNQYLYNQVLDILNKYKLPGSWNNEGFSIPSVCQKALSDFKELGIKFDKIV